MILGCICGGVLELVVFALVSMLMPYLGIGWWNSKQKEKACKAKGHCDCHGQDSLLQLPN